MSSVHTKLGPVLISRPPCKAVNELSSHVVKIAYIKLQKQQFQNCDI